MRKKPESTVETIAPSPREIFIEELMAVEGGWQSESMRRNSATFIADTILPRLSQREIYLRDGRQDDRA